MCNDFNTLRGEFKKEGEYMRVARKATDNLQDEYCRIVHSVASEKQRNLMYIEKAKREFISELIQVNIKMAEVENITKRLNMLEKR